MRGYPVLNAWTRMNRSEVSHSSLLLQGKRPLKQMVAPGPLYCCAAECASEYIAAVALNCQGIACNYSIEQCTGIGRSRRVAQIGIGDDFHISAADFVAILSQHPR